MEHSTAMALSEGIQVVAEIREAINELTKELREVRVALNSINELFDEVIDKGSGQYPGYIRVRQES